MHFIRIRLSAAHSTFALPEKCVFRTVSRMILTDELAAAWDQPTQCLVMAAGDTNAALQRAALRFADKVRTRQQAVLYTFVLLLCSCCRVSTGLVVLC